MWGLRVIVRLGPQNIPRLGEIQMDPYVLSFTVGLSVLTGLLFGLAPGFSSTNGNLHGTLKEGGRNTSSTGRHRLRSVLVVSEVALCFILLTGAGLLTKSFYRLMQVDPGFRSENVLTFRLSLPESRYPSPKEAVPFFMEFFRGVRQLPGVDSVGLVSAMPLAREGGDKGVMAEGMPNNFPQFPNPHGIVAAGVLVVSPGYFQTMGLSLLQGRRFVESDIQSRNLITIVGEQFAREAWGEQESYLGKRVAFESTSDGSFAWMTVVGVVREVKDRRLEVEGRPDIYFLPSQFPLSWWRTSTVAVRTAGSDAGLIASIRRELRSQDPSLAMFKVRELEEVVSHSVAQPRFNTLLLGLFAILALVMGAVGIYGVLACSVSQRTQEIGIRMAVGAQRFDIMRMVLGQSLQLFGIGTAIGLGGALASTRILSGLLFGVTALDPLIFAIVPLLLGTVALLACYIPARRATKVDPMVALRYE